MPSSQIEHFHVTQSEWLERPYNKNIVDILRSKKIRNFIDIGANVGAVAKHLVDNINTIDLGFCFEPQIDNFKFMQEILNDKKNNIQCLNFGVFYGMEIGCLYRRDVNVGGYTALKIDDSFAATNDMCRFCTLESIIPKDLYVDFIKVDVEGAEYNIIENSTVLKQAKYLEIEFHFRHDFDILNEYINRHLPNFVVYDKLGHNYFMENKK